MAARYQHIIAAIRRDIATRVGRLLQLLLTTLPEPWRERLADLFGEPEDGAAVPE